MRVEPTGAVDTGPCDCCGAETRRVWGLIHDEDGPSAAYFVQWAVGRVDRHGALLDLVLGRWGESATTEDRVVVTMEFRVTETGPAFMVVDARDRPAARQGRPLSRHEVVGQPIAKDAFAAADWVLASDPRLAELLGPYTVNPPQARRRWWWPW